MSGHTSKDTSDFYDLFATRDHGRSHDIEHYSNRFYQDADRLFVSDEKTLIKFINVGRDELCYLFKFVEEHGRDYEEGSWSIRQTAVYHRRDTETGKDFVVILNPSQSFQQRWRQATQDEKTKPGAGDLHTLLMSCASSKWNLFVNGLEDQFEPLKTKTHLSRVQPSKENSFPDLHYDDFQDVQVMRDRLHRLSHLLESNLVICQKIARKALGKPALTWINNTHEPTVNGECIKMSYSEMKLQKRRVQTLLRRLDAVAGSMQSTLAFRGLEALYSSGKASAELTHLAQADNRLMLRLTQEAQRDARTLKTITIVTMVYLPASFASVRPWIKSVKVSIADDPQQMLSMGYISISRTPNRIAFHFDGELRGGARIDGTPNAWGTPHHPYWLAWTKKLG
ncbi:MAG: hypothetical protein Q9157_002689 [Trypethelium eluteriae]